MAPRITFADKNTGDQHFASEVNEVKDKCNNPGKTLAFTTSIPADDEYYFPDYTQTGALNFTKDASVVDNEGYGNGVHGVIIANGDAIEFDDDDFDYKKDSLISGNKYFFNAEWRGLKFSASIIETTKKYSADAQSVIDRMTGLTTSEKDAIADFVDSQVTSGNWNLLDEFWCFKLATLGNALTGWKSKTATNVNGSKVANGISFNGTTAYLQSGYIPSVDTNNYTLSDAMLSARIYSHTDGDASEEVGGVIDGSNNLRFNLDDRVGFDRVLFVLNGGNSKISTAAYQSPINDITYIIEKTAADSYVLTKDLASQALTGTATNGVLSAREIYIGALNLDGSPSAYFNGTLNMFAIGGATGFNRSNFKSNIDILLAAL